MDASSAPRSLHAVDEGRTLVIACATVIEEVLPLLPAGMRHQALDFGLHTDPDRLHDALQVAIEVADPDIDTIILGYGLCARAVIGLRALDHTLVVPLVDDCIALFLGSRAAYEQQFRAEPGTYYLTKGWIEAGAGPLAEYEQIAARRGPARAEQLMRLMFRNYTRLALVDTGLYELDPYRGCARETADRFGLRYEEVEGSRTLVRKMLMGPWDDDFVIVPPGGVIRHEHFAAHDR